MARSSAFYLRAVQWDIVPTRRLFREAADVSLEPVGHNRPLPIQLPEIKVR
jgi:hypothetical protein